MATTDNLRASLLMVASMAGFALEDLLLKKASATLPIGQIVALLGLGGTILFAILLRRQGLRLLHPTLLRRAVVIRNLAEMGASVCIVTALSVMPLSSFTAIIQANPLLVTLGGALFLGERVGWRRATAIAVGFAGVLTILRPWGDGFGAGALIAVAGMVLLSARDLATRAVPDDVGTLHLSAWGFASLIPAGLALMAALGTPPAAAPAGLGFTLAAVAIGVFAYYAITLAMRIGEVAVVAPFRYPRLVFAFLLAAAVLGERPDAATLAGSALVVGAGLYTMIREARLRRASR